MTVSDVLALVLSMEGWRYKVYLFMVLMPKPPEVKKRSKKEKDRVDRKKGEERKMYS
jgi:hypothetical protein